MALTAPMGSGSASAQAFLSKAQPDWDFAASMLASGAAAALLDLAALAGCAEAPLTSLCLGPGASSSLGFEIFVPKLLVSVPSEAAGVSPVLKPNPDGAAGCALAADGGLEESAKTESACIVCC